MDPERDLPSHPHRADNLRPRRVALKAAAGLAVAALTAGRSPRPAAAGGGREIVIGGLLSLTGEWSTLGLASQAALELAADDINAQWAATGATARVRIVVADTRLDPDTAVARAQALAAAGVRIMVGPQSSAEVRALKPWADANGVILISQGSTASSLSIPGDNIFRLVPDDVREAEAMVTLLGADGVQTLVPVWRTDAGNTDLRNSVVRLFSAAGGSASAGVSYGPETADFAPVVMGLRARVSDAIARSGAQGAGIYLAGFDEVARLFAAAQDDAALGSVRWYGSDGIALSEVLLHDEVAARYAARVNYPNPLPGLDESLRSRWQPVADRIAARTGHQPDAFGLAAYDATWIAALASVDAGATPSAAVLRDAVTRTANGFDGVTGRTTLNAAGDRQTSSFDFWAIRESGGSFGWVRVARYEPVAGGPGRIVRGP